ncbi:MAG TPA: cytochrome c biogenesis protein CcdA [Candidatus Latescibacteria bacterium]|nr:cytochrome c biogenesis protein CcdA [Candidatus Latescibacterota bacterium]
MQEVTLLGAFAAGIISFISPCVLPLIPTYLSFISGVSLDEMQEPDNRRSTLKKLNLNSLLFILGFSAVFVSLGASATAVGTFLSSRLADINKIAGVVLIILGIHVMGLFKIRVLDYEKRFHLNSRPFGTIGSFVVGVAFGFGWTPCIGPVLAAILFYAGTLETVTRGMLLLAVYSSGLAIPLFLAGVGASSFLAFSKRIARHFRLIQILSGAIVAIIGLLILTQNLEVLIQPFIR